MAETTPDFPNPPVIETVSGVQFARIPDYSTALAGVFWKERLPPEWHGGRIEEVPRVEDQFERFGSERVWAQVGLPGLQVRPGVEPNRLQILRSDNERMIQIQDTRFLYNWRKQQERYPSFDRLFPEFQDRLGEFAGFVRESGRGELQYNQWEVTYVNHILANGLWHTIDDWGRVLPGFYVPPSSPNLQNEAGGFSGDWRKVIGENKGRLHISIRYGRVATEGPDLLSIHLTARGPIKRDDIGRLADGLNLGHDAIVGTFLAMTSPAAKQFWRGGPNA